MLLDTTALYFPKVNTPTGGERCGKRHGTEMQYNKCYNKESSHWYPMMIQLQHGRAKRIPRQWQKGHSVPPENGIQPFKYCDCYGRLIQKRKFLFDRNEGSALIRTDRRMNTKMVTITSRRRHVVQHRAKSTWIILQLLLFSLVASFTAVHGFVIPHSSCSFDRPRVFLKQSNQQERRSEDMRRTLAEFQQFLEDVFSLDIRNSSKKKQKHNKTIATTTIHTRGSQSPNLHLLSSIVTSLQEYLYENTEGWAFSFADLRPASERNFMGHVFLATNLAYVLAGSALLLEKDYLLGSMTELCAVASFQYHFQQLQQPYQRTTDEAVRVALTIDYVTALSSIGIGIAYLVQDHSLPSGQLLATATTGLVFLLLGWIWEEGLPYVVLHSFWHIYSAVTAYLVGTTHIANYPHSGV